MNFASKYAHPSKHPPLERKKILKNQKDLRKMQLNEESIFALDTNVLTIDFSFLKDGNKNISTGDPIYCSSCKAILNSFSRIYKKDEYFNFSKKKLLEKIEENINEESKIKEKKKPREKSEIKILEEKKEEPSDQTIVVKKTKKTQMKKNEGFLQEEESKSNFAAKIGEEEGFQFLFADLNEDEQVWICEFCKNQNRIMLEMEEVPKKNDMVYILESQGQVQDTKNETSLIFCIDNSGSMSITTEIEGNLDLKHSLTVEEYEMLKQFLEPGSEFLQQLPSQKRNHTYVSRKQCVLGAIESQLNELNLKFPNKKVGLVIFNNEVNVLGDGKKGGLVLAGDKLKNYEGIVEEIKKNGKEILSEPLKNSKQSLLERFAKLEETGKTALGPAVLASLLLASEGKKGSMVVICTDGLANIGLGRFDGKKNISEKTIKFYTQLEKFAVENDIIVSLITIKGEDCKTELLGKIVDQTNGNLIRVNPADLAKDFSGILKDEIVATNVDLEIRLHNGLKFKNEDPNSLSADESRFKKKIGNATYNTEIAFQYQIRDDEELNKLGVQINENSRIPFQSQINYLSNDGNKCLRVITNYQSYTKNKQKAEKEADVMFLHKVAAQKSSNWAQMGNYEISRKYNKNWSKYISSNPLFNQNKEQIDINRELETQHRKLRGAIGTKVILSNKERERSEIDSSVSDEEVQPEKKLRKSAVASDTSSNSSDSVTDKKILKRGDTDSDIDIRTKIKKIKLSGDSYMGRKIKNNKSSGDSESDNESDISRKIKRNKRTSSSSSSNSKISSLILENNKQKGAPKKAEMMEISESESSNEKKYSIKEPKNLSSSSREKFENKKEATEKKLDKKEKKIERKAKRAIVDSDVEEEEDKTLKKKKIAIKKVEKEKEKEKDIKLKKKKIVNKNEDDEEGMLKKNKIVKKDEEDEEGMLKQKMFVNQDEEDEATLKKKKIVNKKKKKKICLDSDCEKSFFSNLSCSAGSMNALELSGDEAECTVFKMKKAFK